MPLRDLTRRELIQRLGAAGLVLGGAGVLARARWDHGTGSGPAAETRAITRDFRTDSAPPGLPELVVARNDTDAANTNPKVVAEVVRLCYDAGAKHVVVTDASCNEPNRCFQRSGIWKAAYDMGAEVILPATHRFRTMRLKGEVLDEWPVYTPLVNADKVINVPIAKHHTLAKYTGAMKNWYGSLGGRRNRLHQNIDVSIADLAQFIQPTLTIVDATRVLMRNGPQGGNIADAKDMHTVIATTDQVAADAYGCQLIGRTADEIPYLKMGEERGIGTMHWQNLRFKEV